MKVMNKILNNNLYAWLIISSIFLVLGIQIIEAKSTYSSDRIKNSVEKLVLSKIGSQAEIEFTSHPRTIDFDEDNIDAEIIITDELKAGLNTIGLKFSNENRILKYIEVNIRIKLMKSVWVAARSLKGQTILSADDLVLKEKFLNHDNPEINLNNLIGKELLRSVAQDEIVNKSMLASDVMFKRGEKVTLIVESGAVRIRCIGIASQDGIEGQSVRVKRDNSPNVLVGKVSADGSVIIYSNNISMNQEQK